MNICIFGNSGVGKSFIKTWLKQDRAIVHEIENLKDPSARTLLQECGSFIAVFVITTEGGRLQSDDVQILQSRSNCIVFINKTDVHMILKYRVQSLFQHAVKVLFVPVDPNDSQMTLCRDEVYKLVPQPYEAFFVAT